MKNIERVYRDANKCINPKEYFEKRTLEKVFDNKRKASFSCKKVLASAIAAVLVIAMFAGTAYAVSEAKRARLSDMSDFSSATDIYAEKLARTVLCNGLSVTLSEALFENGKLYITFYCSDKEAKSIDSAFWSVLPDSIMVDGKNAASFIVGTCSVYGDTTLYMVECDLSELDLTGVHDFSVSLGTAEIMYENGDMKTVNGAWSFDFQLDTSALASQTQVYNIEKDITLFNGDVISLEKIVCTPLSQRLYYTIIPAKGNKLRSYRIKATGDDCEFTFSEMSGNNAQSVNIYPDSFDFDAESITLEIKAFDRYDNVCLEGETAVFEKADIW